MKSSSIISLFALTIASMSAVTYAAEADATNNIRGRNLEEDAKVDGVRW